MDTTDCGTTSIGGGVPPRGSDKSTLTEIKTFAYAVENLSDRAADGRGARSESNISGTIVKKNHDRQKGGWNRPLFVNPNRDWSMTRRNPPRAWSPKHRP